MSRELRQALKLTVSVGGDERHAHHPLYREVLKVLHEQGITGATLTKGVMSYGCRRRIHSTMNEITMENLPIIIEAVGEREQIEAAAKKVSGMLGEHGLVQLQPTMVIHRSPAEDERRDAHA